MWGRHVSSHRYKNHHFSVTLLNTSCSLTPTTEHVPPIITVHPGKFRMPTQSLTAALLLLGDSTDGLLWKTSAWESLMRIHGVLWTTDQDGVDDSPSRVVPEWMVRTSKSVKVFVENVWKKSSDDAKHKYIMSRQLDNDSTGWSTWSQWVSKAQKGWGLNAVIDNVLTAHGSSPREVLKTFQVKSVSYYRSITHVLIVPSSLLRKMLEFICAKRILQHDSSATMRSRGPRIYCSLQWVDSCERSSQSLGIVIARSIAAR